MKVLKVIGIVLGAILILAAGALALLATVYEDEVEALLIEQINQSVKSEVEISNANFSLLRKFPFASLELQDVTVYEPVPQAKGVLMTSESIFLKLHLWDLITGTKTLERVEANKAVVNIKVWEDGSDNYHFYESSDTSAVNLDLNLLEFKDVAIYYVNEHSGNRVDADIERLSLTGSFHEEEYELNTSGKYYIHQIVSNGKRQVNDIPLALNTALHIDNGLGKYEILSSDWTIGEVDLEVDGSIRSLDKGMEFNLHSSGDAVGLDDAMSILPSGVKENLEVYDVSGTLTYDLKVKGPSSNTQSPAMMLDFNIGDGEASHNGVDLSDLNVKGSYVNKSKAYPKGSLDIETFTGELEGGPVKADLKLINFNKPTIDLNLELAGELSDYTAWLQMDTVEQADGNINANISLKGTFKDLANPTEGELSRVQAKGSINLEKAGIKLQSVKYGVTQLEGLVTVNNDNWSFEKLTGVYGSSDIEVTGRISNALHFFLLEEGKLKLDLDLMANLVELEEIMSSTEDSDDPYDLQISRQISGTVRAKVGELIFDKFSAQSIETTLYFKDGMIEGKNTKLLALGGILEGDYSVAGGENVFFGCDATLTGVDVERVFYEFNNFGQEMITDDHLSGRADARIHFVSLWSPSLEVDLDRITATVELDITEGRLKDYTPLEYLGKYIEVDELMDVKFSRLQQTVMIKEQTVYIPKTFVKSSALDLLISGEHNFKNEIDYQFVVRLSDVLGKKAKKKKKENNEFGIVEDDGLHTRLFLRMTGTVDEPIVKYDKKGVKEKWQEDMKREKQTIKSILKDEFNWFKKDTTVKSQKKPKKDDEFEIEWKDNDGDSEGSSDPPPKDPDKEKDPPKKEGKLKKFFKKATQENEEEYEDPPE